MPFVKMRQFKAAYERDGYAKTAARITEALEAKQLKPTDFSLRDMAETLVKDGAEWLRTLDPRQPGGYMPFQEASAVSTADFANITGQIVYTAMMETYVQPDFFFTQLIPNKPTRFSGEKIPGIGQMGDKATKIGEGMPYPSVGLNEDYIETPATDKSGLKIPVTKEAIFFDRTNMILDRAGEVGTFLGVNKEKRLIDMVIGVTNNHKWKGTAYNTFQASTPWINVKTGNTLVDWNNIDASEQVFFNITDPNTGEPIAINPRHVVVNRAYLQAAIRATVPTVMTVTPGYATSGNPTSTTFTPHRGGTYQVINSQWFNSRQTAASQDARYWYQGDLTKAFAYEENWPITVTQAPANHPDEFDRDVVVQYKASERGAAAVINPRYIMQNQQ